MERLGQMEPRCRASPEQFAAIMKFMESHGDLARPQQGPQGRIKADQLWQELAAILNSKGGGVVKSMDKWKKVWADWKTKTKKKALAIRRETSRTGGGRCSRQTLTALEERVLGVMGLTTVIGQPRIEEGGSDSPPSEKYSPPPTKNSVHIASPSQSATDEFLFEFVPSTTALTAPPASGGLRCILPPLEPLDETGSAPILSATSSTTSREAPERQRFRASPSSAASTARRRDLYRARTRRIQTAFQRATSDFVSVEHRRLRLEADREKNNHEREMERLRLEARRMDIEAKQTEILSRLAATLDNLVEILPQLRPSPVATTDTIS